MNSFLLSTQSQNEIASLDNKVRFFHFTLPTNNKSYFPLLSHQQKKLLSFPLNNKVDYVPFLSHSTIRWIMSLSFPLNNKVDYVPLHPLHNKFGDFPLLSRQQ